MTRVVIVPTGVANTASVKAAFARLDAAPTVADDVKAIESAEYLVVPGVGSFGSAVGAIDRLGIRNLLIERLEADQPTIAVCVGMQLLAEASTESPDAKGLGVLSGEVTRFAGSAPQLGWNMVSPGPDCRLLEPGWAYFANSYRLSDVPAGWSAALTDHRGQFVSALERGNLLACQFHPELSGSWGSRLLARWLASTEGSE